MIKENYEKPKITVNTFSIMDAVITTSTTKPGGGIELPDDNFLEPTTKPSIELPDIDIK